MITVIVQGEREEVEALSATAKCIKQAIVSKGVLTIDEIELCKEEDIVKEVIPVLPLLVDLHIEAKASNEK